MEKKVISINASLTSSRLKRYGHFPTDIKSLVSQTN